MDLGNIKKKHIIIGTSALVLIAGGITAGVIANNSDEQATNANIAEIQPTTEQVTTAATTVTTKAITTTTEATTTTTAKTTKKPKKTEKKDETKSDNKTEVKDDNTAYENDNNDYDEPQYEEPVKQETPKQDTPAPDPEPAPEPEPEPAPVYDVNSPEYHRLSGHNADLFRYAISQGCDGWTASAYVTMCYTYGESNVMIGNPAPDNPESWWGTWYTTDGGITWTTF